MKRKDPVFHGEIILDSRVNVHQVSLDPVNQPIREDALRKRLTRDSPFTRTEPQEETLFQQETLSNAFREEYDHHRYGGRASLQPELCQDEPRHE